MKIIQIGRHRSGNLWLWRIIENVFSKAGIEKKSFIQKQPVYNLIADHWKSTIEKHNIDTIDIHKNVAFYFDFLPIENMDDYINSVSHVWCHSPYNEGSQKVLSRFDKIVYIIRDPRDTLVSWARYMFCPINLKRGVVYDDNPEQYIERNYRPYIRRWMHHVGQFLCRKDLFRIHFVFYERLLYDFDSELQRLLNYFDINLNENDRQIIKENVSFSSMKTENPHHLYSGTYGQWLRILTDKQKKEVLRIAKPMIDLLHYSTSEKNTLSYDSNKVPSLPNDINETQIRKILFRSNRPTFSEVAERLHKWAVFK